MVHRTSFVVFRLRYGLIVVLLLAAIVVLAAIVIRHRHEPAAVTERVSGKVVVIDPGHGGWDPGAVAASGLQEKDITLAIGLHLERLLQRAAVHVIMTRRTDIDLSDQQPGNRKSQDLSRRVMIARAAEADLFISIHGNSFPSPIWSGAQTFYFPNDMPSRGLAEAIQGRLVSELGPNRRQVAAADYYVLREASMPAVVVEVGFLSHPEESRLLSTEPYQRDVAEAIYAGIIDYLAAPVSYPSPIGGTVLASGDEAVRN